MAISALSARYRVALLAAAAVLSIALLLSSFTAAGDNAREWPLEGLAEPSGLVFHAGRRTLFVVGDEGDIAEVDLEGKIVRSEHIGGDLEGVTYDPSSGHLYVVREGHEIIFEIRASDFKILRRFSLDRTFAGDPNYLRRGGDGIEGLTFVPDADHAEGGRFYAVNQYDPAVLVELALTLRTSKEKFQTARIVEAKEIASAPLSGVTWVAEMDGFLVASALWRRVYVTDRQGIYLASVRVPAIMPEGIVSVPGGGFVIAQDSGGLIMWNPPVDPFKGVKPATAGNGLDAG